MTVARTQSLNLKLIK